MSKRSKKNEPPQDPVLLYRTEDGLVRVDVRTDGETVWLSQEQLSELFDRERSVISKHIANVFKEGEVPEESNVQNLHIAHSTKPIKLYSLNVIISVGYRVKSKRGTQFRIWANQQLREYLVKGFVLDDKRMKEQSYLDRYFDELVERIRDIRTSERQFYRKVADIYATSIDYDAVKDHTHRFYAMVQNKFHFAITGHTAAELIQGRADAAKPNMGLTSWPGERILSRDVTVAKNYLQEDELKQLNNIVEQYLAFAEAQAERRKAMKMTDWIEKLHGFLTLNEREILINAGHLTKEEADDHAHRELEKFREAQRPGLDHLSDFDKAVKRIQKGGTPPDRDDEKV